jgi:hypothetical protein
MGNIQEIPVTEIVERTQKLARVGEDTLDKIRGVVTDVYVREIPAKFDWTYLITGSSLTTSSEIHDGTITMTTGDKNVVLSSGTFPSDCAGWKIKFGGNDTAYDVIAYLSTTSVTINPALWGAQNLIGMSYSLYRDTYPLARGFDRFPKPGGVYRWAGGRKQILPEVQYANYVNDEYQATASTPSKTRLVGFDTAGCQMVEFIPAPKDARVYGYDYIKTLCPLYEDTRGTVSSIVAQSKTVTATGANFLLVPTDGTCFFRVDNLGKGSDSLWYRILSVQGTGQLTLETAFADTGITAGANFTIAQAPKYPIRLHLGIIYGACRQLTVDQNDPNAQFYHNQYASVLSDAKRIYVSRPYSQEIDGVFNDYRYRR